MRAPFPAPLRIGIDIIAIRRILCPEQPDFKRLTGLVSRFLHPLEVQQLDRRFPHWHALEAENDASRQRVAAWLAGRWAAKEAAKKAWAATLIGFKDVRVEVEPETDTGAGGVRIVCDVGGSVVPAGQRPGAATVTEQIAQLSISHDGDYAIATVLASPLHDDISAELRRRKAEAEARVNG